MLQRVRDDRDGGGETGDSVRVIPDAMQDKLIALSEIAARGRCQVHREGPSRAIAELPDPENNTRLPQELCQLVKGSAVIGGREVANDEDFAVGKRVALDCIPATRRKLLDELILGKDVSMALGIPHSTKALVAEDLEALGLVQDGMLSDHAAEYLTTAGILPVE